MTGFSWRRPVLIARNRPTHRARHKFYLNTRTLALVAIHQGLPTVQATGAATREESMLVSAPSVGYFYSYPTHTNALDTAKRRISAARCRIIFQSSTICQAAAGIVTVTKTGRELTPCRQNQST